MINPNFFLGYPVNFKNICSIYPPNVEEITKENLFHVYKRILTISKEDLEDQYNEEGREITEILSPFEQLLNNCYNQKEIELLTRSAFKFFTHEDCYFIYEQKMIVFVDINDEIQKIEKLDDFRRLTEADFFDFQNMIRESVGEKRIEPPNPNEDPRVARIKAKARYRDRVKAKQGGGLDFGATLAAICCMNLGINPLNIGELSYAAISTLIRYYQEKEKYDIDIRSILAGADSKKVKPKYWIRNIED